MRCFSVNQPSGEGPKAREEISKQQYEDFQDKKPNYLAVHWETGKWEYLLREDDLDDIFTVLANLLLLALVLV